MEERIKRSERVAAMSRMICARPGEVQPFARFCDAFDASKSTISEDVEFLRVVFERFGLGSIRTVTGAAGGVTYRPALSSSQAFQLMSELCEKLSSPERVITGDYLSTMDILGQPRWMERCGAVLATQFYKQCPDLVVTVETGGIPIALMTARALGVPMLVAKRDQRIYEGSVVTIGYKTGQGIVRTMSMPRRALAAGQRALIVDDLMRKGGTVRGLSELIREFDVEVVGVGLLMRMMPEAVHDPSDVRALMHIDSIDDHGAQMRPAPWIASCEE